MKFIVPDYYLDFNCKCGDCRHSCCEGWPVRISRKEYYRLLGSDCSSATRSKLDSALKVCLSPTGEAYAELSKDWNGLCKLHREDGLCALQAELGEEGMPEVCRQFPRNTKRISDSCECSCSNGCEAVVELLMGLKEPMSFVVTDISSAPKFEVKITSDAYEVCHKSIRILQDRSLSLPDRFLQLGNYLSDAPQFVRESAGRSLAYQVLLAFDRFYEDSTSIGEFCLISQRYYCVEGKEKLSDEELQTIDDKYRSACKHLDTLLPDWPILLEQLMVNHMFYNRFPYTNPQINQQDAFLTLAIAYAFVRINLLGFMADQTDLVMLSDFFAAMFRLIDHSDFNNLAVKLFRQIKIPVQQCVPELLSL